jgi:hypothetical protein
LRKEVRQLESDNRKVLLAAIEMMIVLCKSSFQVGEELMAISVVKGLVGEQSKEKAAVGTAVG